MNEIAFPGLDIYLENVPSSFKIFGFEIALYGLVIALGMFLAISLISRVAVREGYSSDIFFDISLIAIFFGVIGARIYYVIFSWDYYKEHLGEIFNLRRGGLGIYGGILLGIFSVYIYTKYKKIDFLNTVDIMIVGVPVGQMMGRWGNFFNREAFGGYTHNLFRMEIPLMRVRESDVNEDILNHLVSREGIDFISVHPTFLYESLVSLSLVIILLVFFKYKKYKGEVFFLYNILYGIGRFIIEGLRTDQLVIGKTGVPISQVVAMILIICGLLGFYFTKKKSWIIESTKS